MKHFITRSSKTKRTRATSTLPVVFESEALHSPSSFVFRWMKAIPVFAYILFFAMQAQATTLLKKNLADLVAEADGIVVGTVSELNARYDKKKDINTYVTLNDLKVVHGQYDASSLVLQLRGGEIEGDVFEIHGSPKFETKDRVIIFLKDNGREMVPIVGWTQGVFRVAKDEKTGNERIKDHEGNNVVEVSGDELVKEQINRPEAEIVDGRGQSAIRSAGAGHTDDGSVSEFIPLKKKSAQGEALSLREFMNSVSQKLKEKGASGKKLASASLEPATESEETQARDAAPRKSE